METQNKTITYVLAILLIAILTFGGYAIYTLNGKIIKQNETIEELRNENKKQQATIKDLNENKEDKEDDKADNQMTEENIEKLFLAKLKKVEERTQEKLLDYRVDSVKIYTETEKKQLPSYSEYPNAVFALVTYSVKPKNVNSSVWASGNGEVENEWIVRKSSCEKIENGVLGDNLATGW